MKVYFDNLVIHHNRGPILQTDNYYPFGLTMAGISDQAALSEENKFLYNGKELQHHEFSDNSGLDWYDYGARMYDDQIGRWGVIDPMSEKYDGNSPYGYVANNPVALIDPSGMEIQVTGAGAYLSGQDAQDFIRDLQESTQDGNSANIYVEGGGSGNQIIDNNDLIDFFHISNSGMDFIKAAEGEKDYVYNDGKGNLTAGWGHKLTLDELRKYREGDEISLEQQIIWFNEDVFNAESTLGRYILNTEISQSQYDAMVDLTFNTGSKSFSTSNFVKDMNRGDLFDASLEFENWNAEGWRGLDTRRANEERLFDTGNYNFDYGLHTFLWNYTSPKSDSYFPGAFQVFKKIMDMELDGGFGF